MENKPTIFSGIQPTGKLHLGNYLGAISQWVGLQNDYNPIFCVVDYHALTANHNAKGFEKKILDTAKIYIAAGIDPKKSIIFQQSLVPEHTELTWLLNSVAARMSDLKKMTQFKDKAGSDQENVSVGLFDYPVLMAADILLYQSEVVPVGEDQVQHIELARDLARRFNKKYGKTFVVPKAQLRKEGARIMGLDDPTKKMSKSADSEKNYIALTDDPKKAAKKIMSAQTDSGSGVKYDAKKPGIANLLTIYSLISGQSVKDLEKMYQGKGYGEFKKDLSNIVSEFLTSFQSELSEISDREIKDILKQGADRVRPQARTTLAAAKKALGF